MERKCRRVPFSKQPLVLALCQVRFERVRKMAGYAPTIQDAMRRDGYPIERSGKTQQILIGQDGVAHNATQEKWEFRSKAEDWSILLFEDSFVLQTTAYQGFEDFAERLTKALRTVFQTAELDEFGVIRRVGLRYVDLVQPRPDEDFRAYLRPGLHGIAGNPHEPGTHRLYVQSAGRTQVGEDLGTLVVRIAQSDNGADLPRDLVQHAPDRSPRTQEGELVTFIDMDHYLEGKFDPNVDWVKERVYLLHDVIIETFHEEVISLEAVKTWK